MNNIAPTKEASKLIELTASVNKTYLTDLSHIPADKLGASPGGVARSPLNFTAECIGFNLMLVDILSGKGAQMPEAEAIAAFYSSIDTFEKAKEGLESSVEKLNARLSEMSAEECDEQVSAPWGEPMSKLALASMAAHHMNYHDGQLNYIQALYGDAEHHWTD